MSSGRHLQRGGRVRTGPQRGEGWGMDVASLGQQGQDWTGHLPQCPGLRAPAETGGPARRCLACGGAMSEDEVWDCQE